jgi:hypothetical protein
LSQESQVLGCGQVLQLGSLVVGQHLAFCSVGQHLFFFSQGGVHFCFLHLQEAVFSHFGQVPQFAGFKLLQENAFALNVVTDKATNNDVANNVFFIVSPFLKSLKTCYNIFILWTI